MVMTTWSWLLFRTFIEPVCIWFFFLPGSNNTHHLINQQNYWCWCHEDMWRVLARVWEFVGILDHNDWRFFVVLDCCSQMRKMKIEVKTLYDLQVNFYLTKTRIVIWNIYSKNSKTRYSRCSSSSTSLEFSKYQSCWVALAFSAIGILSFFMHKIPTAIIRCVIAIYCCDLLK